MAVWRRLVAASARIRSPGHPGSTSAPASSGSPGRARRASTSARRTARTFLRRERSIARPSVGRDRAAARDGAYELAHAPEQVQRRPAGVVGRSGMQQGAAAQAFERVERGRVRERHHRLGERRVERRLERRARGERDPIAVVEEIPRRRGRPPSTSRVRSSRFTIARAVSSRAEPASVANSASATSSARASGSAWSIRRSTGPPSLEPKSYRGEITALRTDRARR